MANAFVYGTLMYGEVLKALIGREPRSAPATISGYQRFRIKQQVFPGTVRGTPDSQVRGLVLFDLRPDEMDMFDDFEGEEYFKEAVQPQLEDGSSVDAIVYVWQDSLRPLLYPPDWSPEEFRTQHLGAYVEMVKRFAADVAEHRQWKAQPNAGAGS
eukprot:scaffold8.g1493.t1